MSPMLSAPATVPATSEVTFNPALAPLSVGTDRCSSLSVHSPAPPANATTGTSHQPTRDSARRRPHRLPEAYVEWRLP